MLLKYKLKSVLTCVVAIIFGLLIIQLVITGHKKANIMNDGSNALQVLLRYWCSFMV